MFFLGSAYPLGKFGLNASMNPLFFGALRMGFVFLCLLPFCKIIIPEKTTVIEKNDEVLFLCLIDDLKKAEELFQVRNVY